MFSLGEVETMKIDWPTWGFLAMVAAVSFCLTPLSYSEDDTNLSSHQKFVSVVNLQEESSANAVIQNNGVVEFRGNELVDSVAKKMAANGTLAPGSTLALSKDGKDMTSNTLPMALVEKDLQTGTPSKGIELDALIGNATNIARTTTIGVPLSGMTQGGSMPMGTGASPSGGDLVISSGIGTGSIVNSPPSPPPQN